MALTALPVLSLVALHPGDDVFYLLREALIVVPVALLPSLIELTLARLLGLALPTALRAVTTVLLRGVLSTGLVELSWAARLSVTLLVTTSLLILLITTSLLTLLVAPSLLTLLVAPSWLALLIAAPLLVLLLIATLLSTRLVLGAAVPAALPRLLPASLLPIGIVLLCATTRVLTPLIVVALLTTGLLLLAAPLLGAAVLSVAPMATLLLPDSLTSAALIPLRPVGAAAGPLFVL